MPEVAATAAPVHSTAAPGYVDEPAITPVTPWVYLSSCGPGTGQRAATSAASKPSTSVSGRSSPMSISLDAPAVGQRVHGFEPAEGDGQRGVHRGAGDRPGRRVDAAGDVDGDHRDPRVVDGGEHLGRGGPQRPRTGDAHHPVDNEIRCRRNPFDDPAARAGRPNHPPELRGSRHKARIAAQPVEQKAPGSGKHDIVRTAKATNRS